MRLMLKSNLLLFIIVALSCLGTVVATPAKDSVNVGSKVSISVTGLTASTTYDVYDDDTAQLLLRFTTDAAETTQTFSVVIDSAGENLFGVYNTSKALQDAFTIIGVDPFDSFVYSIIPFIMMLAVVGGAFAFVNKIRP